MPLDQVAEYRRLGLSQLEVSRVGFGGWAIGGHGWGRVDDQQSFRAIRRAYELGVTLFDTADVYGFGHSEEMLSAALGENRKKVVIATKFGVRWTEQGQTFRDLSPSWVTTAVEASLRRLKLDCIPLYQIHWPDLQFPLEDALGALEKCREQGKIRYIGCANFTLQMLRRANQRCRLESLQIPYNLANRGVEEEILPCCEAMGIGVIAYSPLAQALLSGKFAADARFGPDDVRSRSKYFQPGEFEKNLQILTPLREVARQYAKTPGQIAMRWVLDHPAVTCVIPGIKTPEQAEENVGATGWSLRPEDREKLSASGAP
jgi:myo-inositol catabolism protein IolS